MMSTPEPSTVARAREALRRAQDAEAAKQRKRETANKAAQQRRAEEDAKKHVAEENAKLSRMAGLKLGSVTFAPGGEGTLIFQFEDGTVFEVSAMGDDATCITYGYGEGGSRVY